MALTVEELQVLISANSDQFKGELVKVQEELRALNKATTKAGAVTGKQLFGQMFKANALGTIFTRTMSGLVKGIGNFTKSVVEGGSELSRMKIINQTLAANLGITGSELQSLRDDLKDANTWGTIAEETIRTLAISGMLPLAKQLEAVDARTGETKKGVSALVLTFKDLSASALIPSGDGINRLTKFVQRGNSSFADGIIEVGNLNTEYKSFAESIGKTRNQLSAQELAQARLNIVMREGQKVWGAYANSYQTSGKAISSIGDVLRSIRELIGATFEPVLRVGANAILQFFNGVRASIGQTEVTIKDFANRVAGYMVALVRIIGRLLVRIPVIGKNFEKLANFAVKPITAVSQAVDSVGTSASDAGDGVSSLKKEMAGLAGFDELNVLTKPDTTGASDTALAGIGDSIDTSGLAGGFEDASDQINNFADEAEKQFDRILKPFKEFEQKMQEMTIFGTPVIDIVMKIAKWVGIAALAFTILSPIVSNIVTVFTGLSGVLQPVLAFLTGLNPVVLLVASVIGIFVAALVNAWNSSEEFRNSVLDTWEKIKVFTGELVKLFESKMPAFQEALQPLIDAVGTYLKEGIDLLSQGIIWLWINALKPMIDFILTKGIPILSVVIDVVIKVIAVFAKIAAFIINLIVPAIKLFWNIIGTVFKAVGSALKAFGQWWWNTFNTVLSKVLGFGKKIKNIFSNIWSGMRNSVKMGVNGVISLINRFIRRVNNMIGTVNNVLSSIPGTGKINFRIGEIPKLADGGIVKEDTLAVLHKSSNEAVLPLEGNTGWIDQLADKLNTSSGEKSDQVLIVKIGEDTIFEKAIDYMKDKSLRTGTNILNL